VNLDGEFAKPEQVSKRARQLEEKTQTDHRVHQMHKKLIKLDSVNFFEFVVNPDSFSETVENIFDVSFLVRQDSASLVFDERQNTLVIEAAEPLKASEKQESDTKNVQAVMKLTIPIWTVRQQNHNFSMFLFLFLIAID
jgi:RNA processing factor Prp31